MFQHMFSAAGQQRQILYGGCSGGNGVLTRLEKANVSLRDIHDLFVTHKHTDHLLGVIWVIRNIGQMMRNGSYEGCLHIYCHDEVAGIIRKICEMTLVEKLMQLFDERILIHQVEDGEERQILDYNVSSLTYVPRKQNSLDSY